jgi:hypothetical protein
VIAIIPVAVPVVVMAIAMMIAIVRLNNHYGRPRGHGLLDRSQDGSGAK